MKAEKENTLVVILGPTAVGKTSLSIKLAKKFDSEIISADSRQFFNEISIGTAKPNPEEMAAVPHHFINNKSIQEEYNASNFEKDVLDFLEQKFKTTSLLFMVGGSGLYINAVCNGFDTEIPTADEELRQKLKIELQKKGIAALQEKLKKLDPEYHQTVDLNNSKRVMRAIEVCLVTEKKFSDLRKGIKKIRPFNTLKIGLELPREELYSRINLRVDKMLKEGLEEEARSVESYQDKNALKTVGYQELFDYFNGKKTMEEAIEKIKVNSRRYAKRQMTWFKKDKEIKWFSPDDMNGILNFINSNIPNGKQ